MRKQKVSATWEVFTGFTGSKYSEINALLKPKEIPKHDQLQSKIPKPPKIVPGYVTILQDQQPSTRLVRNRNSEFSDEISCCTDYENSSNDKTLKYPDCPPGSFHFYQDVWISPEKNYRSTIHVRCSGKNEPTRPLGSFG